MVKKRKITSVQSTRSGAEGKEERTPVEADKVSVARNQLRGALQNLLDPRAASKLKHKNDEQTKQQQQQLTKQQQKQKEIEQQRLKQSQKQDPIERKPAIPARRRRRTDVNQVAYHNAYVMKLFDRSVDLAQFKESTPLYPICRAWMANQPRKSQPRPRTPSPETKPKEEPMDEDERPVNGQTDGMDVENSDRITNSDTNAETDIAKDVLKMPSAAPPLPDRFPVYEPQFTPGLKFDFNDPEAPPRDALLRDHLERWSQVRSKWVAASARNEERYAQSGRILKSIYEKAQKAFE